MSNIPMSFNHLIPVVHFPPKKIISYQGGSLSVDIYGKMELIGPIKSAAMGLLKYIIEQQYMAGLIAFELNHSLRFECDNNEFSISYIKENKPEFFDDLSNEFDKLVSLKAFW